MGQERLGPSCFFISLVLGPPNSLVFRKVRTFLKVYMELGSYFLFLQEQIKDIIIIITVWPSTSSVVTGLVLAYREKEKEREG